MSMIAQVVGMTPGVLSFVSGDAHIYTNQMDIVPEQLTREPLPLCTLWLNPEVKDLFAFTPADIRFDNYQYHPAITYPVAV